MHSNKPTKTVSQTTSTKPSSDRKESNAQRADRTAKKFVKALREHTRNK